ncbi:MAG: hypothetical protein IK147_04850 [Clostridia bacterium]|nr:hypothetical protein [Clostridia bacterium]
MRFFKILILVFIMIISDIAFIGCKKESPEDVLWKDDSGAVSFSVNMRGLFAGGKNSYNLPFTYKDALFKGDSARYNKYLAAFSFGAAFSSGGKESIGEFYRKAFFDDVFLSSSYDEIPTVDSVGYSFAHKTVNDTDAICVSVRGYNYGKEWIGNVTVGKTGDHENFSLRAREIYAALKTYAAGYDGEIKILLTGYSRGGGIANALAGAIMEGDFPAKKENVYVYTFAAPKAMAKTNVKKYKNVFNIINSADMVCCLTPESFDLYRNGIDVDIYSEHADILLKAFDDGITLPKFIPNESNFKTAADFPRYILKTLTNYTGEKTFALNDRNAYADNYEETVKYFMGIAYSLNGEKQAELLSAFSGKSMTELTGLLKDDNLYLFLSEYLTEEDQDLLKAHCKILAGFLRYPAFPILAAYPAYKNNFSRMLSMHYPETIYVLLKARDNL